MRTALILGLIFASPASEILAADLLKGADYDWNGPYVGAHAGKAWGETGNSWRNTATAWQPDGDISYDNTAAGLYLGYLWQRGWLAYGIEGDITWSSLRGDDSQFAGLVNALEMNYVSTVRARLGFAHGNALIFATAGIALSEVEKRDLTLGSSNPTTLWGGPLAAVSSTPCWVA